jgi:hypothetical protein
MKQQKLQNNSKSQFDHANKKAANFARKIPALEPIEKKSKAEGKCKHVQALMQYYMKALYKKGFDETN